MLYTAQIHDAAGSLSAVYPAAGSVPTPPDALKRALETRLPQLFGLPACVGFTLPVVAEGQVRACVSVGWQSSSWRGALEFWQPYANGTLRLTSFFYGPDERFARVSRETAFGVLEGLPGLTFDAQGPVVFETLSAARGFRRAEAAAAAGLEAGLGIPVMGDKTATCAVLLLSSAASPLARAFEVWRGDKDRVRLEVSRTLGSPEAARTDASATGDPATSDPATSDLVKSVFRTRLPGLEGCGPHVRLAMPVFRGKTVGSVVVLAG